MTDMTTFDRIKKLAEKRGKSLPAVSADLEFSDNLFYRWKNNLIANIINKLPGNFICLVKAFLYAFILYEM